MNFERIAELLAKGPALTASDVQEIENELARATRAEYAEIAPKVWEAVAQIVNDLAYSGDARLPEGG